MNPAIFKAYDIRGLYPAELDEQDPLPVFRSEFVLPPGVLAYLDGNPPGRPLRGTGGRPGRFVERRGARAPTELYTCECPHGCTLTIGYWKTHAGFTGRNADGVTQFLPIWLGTPYGAKSVQVTNAAQAVSILKFEYGAASNGITKLYAQLLGAKLNLSNGASDADVSSVMAKANAFLALYDYSSWTSLSKKQKSDVLTWMTLLDGYNNGDIGPGHCQ